MFLNAKRSVALLFWLLPFEEMTNVSAYSPGVAALLTRQLTPSWLARSDGERSTSYLAFRSEILRLECHAGAALGIHTARFCVSRRMGSLVSLAIAVLLSGCASAPLTRGGSLGSYDGLAPSNGLL